MKIKLNWQGIFYIALAGLMVLAVHSARAAEEPISVLINGHLGGQRLRVNPFFQKFIEACDGEGIRVAYNDFGADFYDRMTLDYLKQFHVVVFCGTPNVDQRSKATAEELAAFRRRLDAYYKAGGGILWVPLMGSSGYQTHWNELIGDRYDVKKLDEALDDPARMMDINPAVKLKHPLFDYIWTDNIVDHPVTKNVKGLLLPIEGNHFWPGVTPMVYGKSWTVLVHGMGSTCTIRNSADESNRPSFDPAKKGHYESAPEIVGVREQCNGSGRMMVFPIYTAHTWLNFDSPTLNNAMMRNGYDGHASDGFRLIVDGFKWLAKPAARSGLGGYQGDQLPSSTRSSPLDWSKLKMHANSWGTQRSYWDQSRQADVALDDLSDGKFFKGLFGARTTASDGQAGVADYVKVARKLGLSYVVFLEKLESTDDVRYRKLVDDCAAASDQTFAAIPGYLYRDTTGILYFEFGSKVDALPLAKNLTPDRRVKIPRALVDQYQYLSIHGMAELGKMKLDPYYQFFMTCSCPYVYDESTRVDNGLDRYLSLEGRGHQYAPVTLVQTRSPQAMADALSQGAQLTVLYAQNLSDALNVLSVRSPKQPVPAYVTNGPMIKQWGAINPIGHPYFPGRQRVRFVLRVSSEQGLADVKIVNANTGQTYRHFKPDGQKNFSCTIDETHKQQWSLVPIVTDVNGRTALGGTIQTYQDGNRQWMMGDRLMGLHHFLGWDENYQKLRLHSGWLGDITWVKNWFNQAGTYPPNPQADALKIYGIDGAEIHPGAVDVNPVVLTDLGKEPMVQAYQFYDRLSSFDAAVVDYVGNVQFASDDKMRAWRKIKKVMRERAPGNPDEQLPMRTVNILARTTAVRGRVNASVATNMHDVWITFKKDAVLKRINLCKTRRYEDQEPMYLAIRDQDGEHSWQLKARESFAKEGVLNAGYYLYPAHERGGAVGVINIGKQPLNYGFAMPSGRIFIDGHQRSVQTGETIHARFITFTRPWGDQDNVHWLEKLITDFGIGTDKPGYPFVVSQGHLISTNYIMQLQTQQGGATVDVGQYDLPHNLLVQVNGMPANAIAGRYDLQRKQLLILPVFEQTALTSVNTTVGNTNLYVGELFHCDDSHVVMSCVQDSADKLMLEIHNPTDAARTVKLTSVPGFAPLHGLDKLFELKAYTSTTCELTVSPDSLIQADYRF